MLTALRSQSVSPSTKRSARRMRTGLLGAAALASLLALVPTRAEAIPPALQAGTRPMWGFFGMGGAIGMTSFSGSQFRLSEEFGYHFSGKSDGPAIGGILAESFGSGFFGFQVGPKFTWDFQIVRDLGVYLAPTAHIAFALAGAGGSAAAGFNFGFGFEGKLVIMNRGIVFFRPFELDFFAGDFPFQARYNLSFGGGVIF
ncbi:MAG: hypothetical protein IT371_01720 [Deltaproteobacteria bacterium]|nr:hypothetical protein [Deltaproteobacteria bacterium]